MALSMAQAEDATSLSTLAAAQRGDAAAQAALFRLHKDDVARQVLRMTGEPASVDDLVQEVFIAAFGALPGFRREAQLDTWLYRITTNKVRNWWDAKRRRLRREQRVAKSPPAPVKDPEEQVQARRHRERLYAALAQLPDKYREAFTARAIEGLSLQDASERLGVPISTVSYRTRRAESLLCAELDIETEAER